MPALLRAWGSASARGDTHTNHTPARLLHKLSGPHILNFIGEDIPFAKAASGGRLLRSVPLQC
eukprot:5511912-Pyramimonas_sp.AAC.1